MSSTRPPSLDLADLVAELTADHTHRQHYEIRKGTTLYGRDHQVKVPALISQLWSAVPKSVAGDEATRGGYVSRPAGNLEALDVAVRIDLEASRWVRELGEDDPGDTVECVRLLHGLSASAHWCKKTPKAGCCTRHGIEHDARRWWTQARIVCGWDSPAWKPDNTCPMCAERGTLRVNLMAKAGYCVECRETWDEANIGLLADHIREESAGRVRSSVWGQPYGRGGCKCATCDGKDSGMVLCPGCGRNGRGETGCPRAMHHGMPCRRTTDETVAAS